MESLNFFTHPEHETTRTTMPDPVFDELVLHESLHPQFHAFHYTKSCTEPDNCIYTISGTDIPDDTDQARKASLIITHRQGKIESQFTYEDDSHKKIAA